MSTQNRILIADDNAANRELLEAYLAAVDCEIETAVDGQDTLDKTASFQPDLILDGGELMRDTVSTVVEVTNGEMKILRQGALVVDEIK